MPAGLGLPKRTRRTTAALRAAVLTLVLAVAAACGEPANGPQPAPGTAAETSPVAARPAAGEQPSILLVVSDTLRADALECYGGAARTPNICSLAERGARFERAYSNGPWTLPSAVSMTSGNPSSQYALPMRVGSEQPIRFQIPDAEVLLAEALAERGYDRVSMLENPLAGQSNNRQGFSPRPLAGRMAPEIDPRLGFDDSIRRNRKLAPALRYLRGAGERPFFLLVWINDPHAYYSPPPKYMMALEEEARSLPRPLAFYVRLGHANRPEEGEHKLRDVLTGMSGAELQFLKKLYLGEVESVDERVGYLLRALELAGRARDTVVVFTSDHGEGFGEHGSYLHGETFYDELLHVPLLVAGPGIDPGQRIETPVSHVDLMPTLAELTAAECLERPLGRSLAPLLRGERPAALVERDHYVVSPLRDEGVDALIRGRYKLIAAQEDRKLELYDLIADPGETRTLATTRQEVAHDLLRAMRRLRKANEERRQETLARVGVPSQAEDEETLRQLKALGYVD